MNDHKYSQTDEFSNFPLQVFIEKFQDKIQTYFLK